MLLQWNNGEFTLSLLEKVRRKDNILLPAGTWFVRRNLLFLYLQEKVSQKDKFPVGMLGIHFTVGLGTILQDIIPLAIQVQYPLNLSRTTKVLICRFLESFIILDRR